MGGNSKGFVVAAGVLLAGGSGWADLSFNDDIRPILSNTCFACHGPDEAERKADLRLDTREGALADLGKGFHAIVPGDLEASELVYRITADDEDDLMPPPKFGKPLTPEQIATIKQWVSEGAPYERHWAYTKPQRPPVPVTRIKEWSRTPVDAFLLERLEKEGLRPSPEADRDVLGRRVALDLTGLPLTPEEAEAFAKDPRPDAYEKLVRDLLDRPAFGEHWARMWLDLARYADSAGYADDPLREIWAFRDYVIRSFNANTPFDVFTREQIAGDLLPDPSEEQLIATAFHRNTQTNSEGGTDDEEYRNVAIVDRVNTTGQVWLGTTLACAQCHTHKYDPVTQEEYFEMFAILNNTEDTDKKDERPVISIFTDEQRTRKAGIQEEIEVLKKSLAAPSKDILAGLAKWEANLAGRAEDSWMLVAVEKAEAASGATFTTLDDHSQLVSGKSGKTDTYKIDAVTGSFGVTAVKLEVLPHQSLGESKGPGGNGNFVLNEIEFSAGPLQTVEPGRYLRIELPGKNRLLQLAEVQVFDSQGNNLALKGSASQSSDYADAVAARAIDGNTDGDYNKGSVAHTAVGKNDPFWEVDLGGDANNWAEVKRVVVWNRTDGNTGGRLDGFKISLLDPDRHEVWSKTIKKAPKRDLALSLVGAELGKFSSASSTFEQKDFGAAKAIDGDAGGKSGWAVAPEVGKAHHAIFNLERPLFGPKLRVTLKQSYADHAIGRFRLSVANNGDHRAVPHAIAAILAVPKNKRSEAQLKQLLEYFSEANPATQAARQRLQALEKELAGIKPATTVPVMQELAEGKRRKTHIQIRGNFLAKDKEVGPGVPEDLHGWPEGLAKDRLGLAEWILDPENPLTARVVVNRFWEKIFGIGLVATSEEFGSQGEAPSHPELLDWLAVDFVESGWDVKELLQMLVTSAAYRQDSLVTEEMAERDPVNRLLARGPRFRLTAEMVRDQSLFASGLLSPKMYGPPVNPPQPELGVKAAFGGGIDWKTSTGEDRYRRGIYTRWRRSNPYPSMATFDAPNREVCTVRRDRTNTPLQAFVTLNDPVFVEAAQGLARRMAKGGKSTAAKVRHGYQLCLGRVPEAADQERLVQLYESSRRAFADAPAEAMMMATDPLGPLPEGSDPADLAALTVVGNVLLNLDEMLMKR